MRIVINGAGIAGPTLAYWLRKAGHEVLLVEAAPQLRSGGYVIDFGLVGYDIAEKMGLIPRLRELGYQVREMRFVDRHGRKSGGFSVDVFAPPDPRPLHTLRRSDLAATIYGALDGTVETIFGDSVARIEEAGTCVRVGFDHAAPREADLVIGADGLHSRVRQLVFGPDAGVEVSLGYHVAAFEVEGYRPRDELVYLGHGVPGRQIYPLLHARRQDALSLRFSRRVPAGREPRERPGTQSGADERLCRCRLGMPADPRGPGERRRHLFRPGQPDPTGSLDERPHGAGRRCRGLRLPHGRRRARGWRWPRRTCWRASCAIAGAITARPSLATRSG